MVVLFSEPNKKVITSDSWTFNVSDVYLNNKENSFILCDLGTTPFKFKSFVAKHLRTKIMSFEVEST